MNDWHTDTAKPYKRLSDCLPTATDADSNGDVLFLRSGSPTLGKWNQRPIDATHWRHTDRYLADKPIDSCVDVSQETLTSHQLARLLLSMGDAPVEVYYPDSVSKLRVQSVEAVGEWVFINIE